MFALLAQAHAATNNIWLSLATAAQCAASLPSRFVGPNGYVRAAASAKAESRIVLGDIDLYDTRYVIALTKARAWRRASRQGYIYRDRQVGGPRSANRTIV
ncbi:MAG: hypothetical protein MO852_03680 [Candidatus Devosia euplotis]|nr:hypothetical protein [Candidatus Devosia euplotis]